MLTKRLLSISALAGSLAASMQGASLWLTTGAPATDGLMQFEFVAPDGSQQPVSVEIRGGESAAEKVKRIRDAVEALEPAGQWRARDDESVSIRFEHFDGNQWTEIQNIRGLRDDSAGPVTFKASEWGLSYGFGIDPGTNASGVDHTGRASLITIVVSRESGSTVRTKIIPAGTSPESLIADLVVSLQADGFSVLSVSATSLKISLDGMWATVAWQITDTAITRATETNATVSSAGNLIKH